MAVNLVTVTGNLETLIGSTPSLGRVRFKINRPDWNLAGDVFAPEYREAVADAAGAFTIDLQTTDDLEYGSYYTASLLYRDTVDGKDRDYELSSFYLPDTGPHQLSDLLLVGPISPLAPTILASQISDASASGLAVLTGTPAQGRTALELGTAAQSDIGDFATAAQGATADTALQPTDIGVSVQGYDAELAALASLVGVDNRVPYFTGPGAMALAVFTAAARTFNAATDAAAQRTAIGLAIGTNVQAYDADLQAIAGLTSAADTVPYFTGSGTAALATLTAAARTFIAATTTAAQRSAIGLAGAMKVETTWNPIGGVFPGAGVALKGDLFRVSGFPATVDGVDFEVGDVIFALVDNASTSTYAANWFHLPANQFFAIQQAIVAQMELDASADGVSINVGGVSVAVFGPDGMGQLTVGPYTLQIGFGDYMRPPGIIQDGAITNVTKSGEYWQYRADGVQFLVHDAYPEYTPGLMDTTVIDIALRNGQSWNTQIRIPVDLNNEDPTGYTRRRMDNYNTAEFVVPRCELDFSPRIPWDNRAIKRRAYSNDGALSGAAGPVTGLRLWKPGISRTYSGGSEVDFFTIGDITSLSRQHFLRELRLPRQALVSVQAGRAGTSEEYFLASGSSFAGSGGTVNAAILAGNTNYFFTNDTTALSEIAAIIEADWFDKPVTYSVETFDQGGAGTTQTADDDHFFNFLTARRADVNSRALPCLDGTTVPWLIVPIGFAASKETDQGYQAVDQCRWSDANAGGKDLAVGPFYHLKLLQESVGQSAIHGTAMHNLRKGEMMGLVEACVISPAWGRVDRFKITGVNHYPGNNKFTLTVNSPELASGLPLIDTTEIEAAAQYGFTVKRGTDSSAVAVTVTVTGQSYIDVTYAPGALSGETTVLLDYAGFGVSQADAVVGQGCHSACWGNIKKAGLFTGPISRLPIDFWLSPYRENVTL